MLLHLLKFCEGEVEVRLYFCWRDDLDQFEFMEALLEVSEVACALIQEMIIESIAVENLICLFIVRQCFLAVEQSERKVTFTVYVLLSFSGSFGCAFEHIVLAEVFAILRVDWLFVLDLISGLHAPSDKPSCLFKSDELIIDLFEG